MSGSAPTAQASPSPSLPSLLSLALQHIAAQQWDAAEAACQQLLQHDPLHPEAHHLQGHAAGQRGDTQRALALLHRAVALAPRHPQYRYNLAVSLQQAGLENEAALQYQACLRHDPGHRDALWNYGEMLRLAERFNLAVDCFERFAQGGGYYPALYHRLAVSCAALERDAQADTWFQQQLAHPDAPAESHANALTHWEYALFLLSRERFAEGFAHYRQRFSAGGRNSVYCHAFDQPLWSGQFSPPGTLLIHGEQGLGDEIMFASVLPEVLAAAQQTGSRVILAVKPALVKMFAFNFPQAIVRPHKVGSAPVDLSGLGPVDWQLPMGDLPALFRRSLADFAPACRPYLVADAQRSAHYAAHLAELEPAGAAPPLLRVGLMWGSNPANVNAKFVRWTQQRSIAVPLFEQLAHLVPAVRFVSLQNHERGAEAALAPTLDIFDLSAQQTDFFETAALISNLDLVISVDTSVSHLAGAMGVETWVPLMVRSDWRHGQHRAASYWYPHTRYFHQARSDDWQAVLQEMAQALAQRLAQPSPQPPRPAHLDLAQAKALLDQRRFDAARPFFEKALATDPADPAYPTIAFEYAMQLLTEGLSERPPTRGEGALARGWDFHEARLAVFGWQQLHLCPLPWPQWRGEPLAGRSIVVHGEQGVGDEIMYLSMLPDLIAKGARVIVACQPSLVALVQYSHPGVLAVAHPRGQPQAWQHSLPAWTQQLAALGHPAVDYQIPMGSLASQLRRRVDDFPRQPYLRTDPARVAALAQHLGRPPSATTPAPTLAPAPGLRVGMAWCGSLGDANARNRSLSLAQLRPLLDVASQLPGLQLVSLQSRQHAHQSGDLPGIDLLDMSAHTDDFADLAALMASLDLVISIDTSYAHLSGALGRPTWRLVMRNCDWRWGWYAGSGSDDSLWYDNDRLFRQPVSGDWASVIARVASELQQLHARHTAPSPPEPTTPPSP